jgi:alpha-glucosidase (family GH31 glycosyl hydrolase)
MAISSIKERYKYLDLVYQCMFSASQKGDWFSQGVGTTCFDPLFFNYPDADGAFDDIESTFIVADTLKVSPVLQKKIGQEYEVFFPKGTWIDMKNFKNLTVKESGKVGLAYPDRTINVHLMPGKIV